MKDLFYFIYTSSLMVKQRTPNSQDERSNRSAYDKLSGIGVTVACGLWRLGAVVQLHHTRNKNFLPLVQLVERRIWDAKVTRSNRVWEIYCSQWWSDCHLLSSLHQLFWNRKLAAMQEVLKTFYVVTRREFESHRFRFESRDELVGKITRKFNEY